MMVHQFHSGTAIGDAVTNQMLLIRKELIKMGYSASEIYAEYIDERLKEQIKPFSGYRGNKDDILIIHHSMGITEKSFQKIQSLPNRKVLIYHNITPEKYFDDQYIINAIRNGLRQVSEYTQHFDYLIAASNFNRRDLIHLGSKDSIDVLPVHISLDRFDKINIDTKLFEELNNKTNILFVGRIVWNKCQKDLVKTFAVYYRCFNPNSRLILVGDTGMSGYVEEIWNLAKQLNINESVLMPGKVSESELKTYYQAASVFFCMSMHEGFGVPLLEAMKMRVPVLAFRSSAIPETMNSAGIIANRRNYGMLAAMLDELVTNIELREAVIERQEKRIKELEKIETGTSIKKAIANVEKNSRKWSVQIQGPFETSYSLAIVNRKLAEALDDQGKVDMSIYCTEGPGDYRPKEKDLDDKEHAKRLWQKSPNCPYPDVIIRNMYPPRVRDVKGGLNFQAFGWEESVIPSNYIDDFNTYLDGIGTMSDYVTRQLIECGIKIPVRTMGIGVELSSHFCSFKPYSLKTKKRIKFLHISSAFPRKGVDILLEAFFEAFTNEDDVCLVLKTFPNPHNEVEKMLEKLRENNENAPEVEWINKDLKQEDLESLYKAADCYVSVARGEGFGLPVAEAMLAKIPVIVSPNTGMADFCNEETALLVSYEMTPAKTHLTTGDANHVSLWAEPNKKDLMRQMRFFVNHGRDTETEKRVQNAYNLISTRFTWKAVADRWYSFMRDVEKRQRIPKVGMVTTWNNKCGIAEYARLEVEASERVADYKIYPNKGVDLTRPDEEFVEQRLWKDVFEDDLSELTEKLVQSDREIIHFQFNFGFFSLKSLATCIRIIKESGKHVIITFHKTADALVLNKTVSLKSIVPSLNQCDAIVVHQQDDFDRLVSFGINMGQIHIISLGQLQYPFIPASYAKEQLGIKSSFVLGSYGFLLPHKGIKEIIQAMPAVLQNYPDAIYIPVCSLHEAAESSEYLIECRNEIDRLGLKDHVHMETKYLANDESMRLLHACDMMCMTYKPSMESASGATRFCLAARRPTITTKQKIFDEFKAFTKQIDKAEPQLISQAILELAKNTEEQNRYTEKSAEYIDAHNWYRTAQYFQDLYLKVLSEYNESK